MSSMIDLLASEMEHGGPHVHFAGFILFIREFDTCKRKKVPRSQ